MMGIAKLTAGAVTVFAIAVSVGTVTVTDAQTPRAIHWKTAINPQPLPPVTPPQPAVVRHALKPGGPSAINPQPLPPIPPPAKKGPPR